MRLSFNDFKYPRAFGKSFQKIDEKHNSYSSIFSQCGQQICSINSNL